MMAPATHARAACRHSTGASRHAAGAGCRYICVLIPLISLRQHVNVRTVPFISMAFVSLTYASACVCFLTPLTETGAATMARGPLEKNVESCHAPAQAAWHATVKEKIAGMVRLQGHGGKSGKQTGRYAHGSPWWHPPEAAMSPHAPTHNDFCVQSCFLVCWEYLFPWLIQMPPCPLCKKSQRVIRRGWDPAGRKVYGLHNNYYLIGFQYECKKCANADNRSHSFAPWNPDVVSQLPREFQELMPCMVLARSAVDLKIVEMMEPLLVKGFGFEAIENLLRELYVNEHKKRELSYYMCMETRRVALSHGTYMAANPAESARILNPPKFSEFSDATGYAGSSPSDNVLQEVWHGAFKLREHWYHRRAQLVGGEVLSADASHKIVSDTTNAHRCKMSQQQ
jgi:hypothetical protein